MQKKNISQGITLSVNETGHKIVSVEHTKYEEGIKIAKKLFCDGFYLQCDSFANDKNLILDFSLLNEIKNLQYLAIGPNINFSKNQKITPLYKLSKLTSLSLHIKNLCIDLVHFPNLSSLNITFSKSISNFNTLSELQFLWLWHIKFENLEFLGNIENLKEIKIQLSNIQNLNGLENLKNLETIKLIRCTKLVDLAIINNAKKIRTLSLMHCKGITDFSFLKNNTSIETLSADEIKSLSFLQKVPTLSSIGFSNLEDGDITSIITLPTVKKINFYPNKKHYSHTNEQIQKLLNEKESI